MRVKSLSERRAVGGSRHVTDCEVGLQGVSIMADIKALRHRMEEDSVFAEKIRSAKSVDEIVAVAGAEGIVLSNEAIEELAEVSEEDARKAAGGVSIIGIKDAFLSRFA